MYLLFDIGGTKTRFAFSRDGKKFCEPVICGTPQNLNDAKKHWEGEVIKATSGRKIKAATGGVPGTLSKDRSKLFTSPNLRKWEGKNVKSVIEKIIKAPVMLENDADMVGLGEAVYGAGKGYGIVAYITVSTGMGGTRIVRDKIDQFSIGFEPGHQIVEAGNMQTLSMFMAGGQLKKKYGKEATEINDKKVWNKASRYLGIGLNNANVFWSPDVFVLGGSIALKRLDFGLVKASFKKANSIYTTLPKIKKAKLGDLGGLWGALAYLAK
jgi:predicted NBD/HSP70 family sugar kinase